MRGDQYIRGVGILVVAGMYTARLATVGNGTVDVFGYQAAPYAVALVTIVLLALPETIDKLPFGPTREN